MTQTQTRHIENTLDDLRADGFDASTVTHHGRRFGVPVVGYRVRCSCCEALVINGIATHEAGCPNRPRRCRECGGRVPAGESCCQD